MPAHPSRLEIKLLGPPDVTVDGTPLSVDTRKAVALLAYLAVTSSPVTRDELGTLFWPEADADRSRSALRRTLSTLRSGLGGGWLDAGRDLVVLDRAGLTLDVDEARAGLEVSGAEAIPDLESVDRLHRGRFMAGFYLRDAPDFDAWATGMDEATGRVHRTALAALVDEYSAVARYLDAAGVARRWIGLDPLDESAHRRLMLVLAWAGDRNGAVEAYRACVRVLDAELGVLPLEETTELYEAILEEDLPRPPVRRTGSQPAIRAPSRRALPEIVGRERELATLVGSLGGPGRAVLVTGEPGIGKTRLLEELVEMAGPRPALPASASRTEQSLPFGIAAFILREALAHELGHERLAAMPDWVLAEAGRVVPQLARVRPGIAIPPPLDHPSTELRFQEGLIEAVSGVARGGVIAIDDGQNVDPASMGLLSVAARRVDRLGFLLVVSCRPDELAPGCAFATAAAEGVFEEVELQPLGPADAEALHRSVAGAEAAGAELLERTGGIPLFLVEGLESETGRARATLRHRVDRLGEVARQVLAAAAVLGPVQDERLLRVVAGRSDDETVSAVEELLVARLLRVSAEGAIGPAHDIIRESVYAELSLARRRLLHRRSAEALARDSRMAAVAAAVHHFRLAGLDVEAADFARRAGDMARAVFAHAEAEEHFRTALGLGHPDRPGIHRELGDLATLRGDLGEARSHYLTALASAEGAAGAVLEHRVGDTARRLGDFETAERHYGRAEAHHPDPSSLHADWALLDHRRGDAGEAWRHAQEARATATTAAAEARALDIMGMLEPDPAVSAEHLNRSLELAGEDPVLRTAALNNLGVVAERSGDLERALSLTSEALELAGRAGDLHRQAALHNRMADLHHRLGDVERSRDQLTAAVTRFRQIGSGPDAWEPEVWMLAQW